MFLGNDKCNITIKEDMTYTINSADNKYYDITLNPDNYNHNSFYKTLSIYIDLFSKEISIALIGSFYTYDSNCAVLDENSLIILQDNTITEINIFDGSIQNHKKFDCFGCTFLIHKIKEGYLVCGELEILMLDFEFNKKWGFSGYDVFIYDSRFKIHKDYISVYDFEENLYNIDFEGKIKTTM